MNFDEKTVKRYWVCTKTLFKLLFPALKRYFLGVLYGENRLKSENWATLTPHSSATVCRRQKLTDLGSSLALGLQCGVNSISLQRLPWPVACSDWGACLTPSKFGVLGANNPWIETFHKFLSKICVSTTIHVSRPHLAKIGRSEVAEKSSGIAYKKTPASGTCPSPAFRPYLADCTQNFVNAVSP